MRKILLGLFIITLLLHSSFAAFIFENKDVINPILKKEDILNLINARRIVPIYLENGTVIFYDLNKNEIVKNVRYGNLNLISNISSNKYEVVLNDKDLKYWRLFFVLRNLSDDLDLELLKLEDPLFYGYVLKRYPSLESYLRHVLSEQGLKRYDLRDIEDFLRRNYDINPLYDFRSLYTAILDKRIGYSQYYKILKVLIKNEGLIRASSQLYRDPLFRKLIENLPEDIKREMVKEIIKELLEEGDIKTLIALASFVDKKELIEILRDVFRELMKDKEIDEIYKKVLKNILKQFKTLNYNDIFSYIKGLLSKMEKHTSPYILEILAAIFLIAFAYLIKI